MDKTWEPKELSSEEISDLEELYVHLLYNGAQTCEATVAECLACAGCFAPNNVLNVNAREE